MEDYGSIVIQPAGQALDQSYKLDHPVFTLRAMPVREQYRKANKKIMEIKHPELIDKKEKTQSVSNMLISNKGTSLDM